MASWACSRCTFINPASNTTCEVCGFQRGATALLSTSAPPLDSLEAIAVARTSGVCPMDSLEAGAAASLGSAPPLPPPSLPPPGEAYRDTSEEKRIDPNDKQAYTLCDLKRKYKGVLAVTEIEAFWKMCKPVQSQAEAPGGGYHASAASAPLPAVTYQGPCPSPQCAWLVAEALKIEARAVEFDRAGSSSEAILHHRRATVKLEEAASSCPEEHPDRDKLSDLSQDIQLRMVYLEGLGGQQPTLPVEEHVVDPELIMDLSCAEAPTEDVAGLVAKAGISAHTAPLTEEGYQLVAALKSDADMKVLIIRLIHEGGRTVQAANQPQLDAFVSKFIGVRQVQSLAALRDAILRQIWVEVTLDPKRDKLELAMSLQAEANRFDSLAMKEQAVEMFSRSSAILKFIIGNDRRMTNAKVKEMVEKRLEDIEVRAAELSLSM